MPPYPKFLLDALYCSEQQQQHWEEETVAQDHLVTEKLQFYPLPPFLLLEQDMCWDDEELTSLLAKEQRNPLSTCLLQGHLDDLEPSRTEALEWMLRVNAHYSFSALTALLAANYLDRFLSVFCLQNKPWMTQLAAVACLSLAAKVEETHVPLLLDLQVEDCRYVFEAKTIKRMELLVLSNLDWKMNPATPVSFLDYITRRLGLKDHLCFEFLRRCEGLLLSLIADSTFMSYLPSVLATATMMQVVNGVDPRLGVEYQNQLLGILGLGINKEEVDECRKLMQGKMKQCCNKRKCFGSVVPGSPNGVMDVSFSSDDSSNDSWAVSPPPPPKKSRTEEQLLLLNIPSSDFLTIPR